MTGVERPGYEIAVQKIEIIHPDGTTQTMVETSTEGESKTWDFAYLRVCSVLLPSWSSNGKDGPVNMEAAGFLPRGSCRPGQRDRW